MSCDWFAQDLRFVSVCRDIRKFEGRQISWSQLTFVNLSLKTHSCDIILSTPKTNDHFFLIPLNPPRCKIFKSVLFEMIYHSKWIHISKWFFHVFFSVCFFILFWELFIRGLCLWNRHVVGFGGHSHFLFQQYSAFISN